MRILLFMTFLAIAIPAHAQFYYEASLTGGYPLMLSGAHKFSRGIPAIRIMAGYRLNDTRLQPYLVLSTGAAKLPLQSQPVEKLTIPVLATSFMIGLSGVTYYDEGRNAEWIMGGGIGLLLIRRESYTLYQGDYELNLPYTSLLGDAWYPKAEYHLRWTRYSNPEGRFSFYFGALVMAEAIWMRDTKTRYTASINGDTYNIRFNSFVLMPSVGALMGFRL
ncbi:hypothetical protein [Taibaiella chishuiensis]|uniref:Outer membrane protein with beta-barrel domain n=1 Tax=Taibaiella chishuiensis TaxID=1434707 RepID=A0A2P8D622_9BACT|nr:hypothetical protein [Taibaiella chishuiensis]PSK92657.1 hypothetical protein B0I18_103234 [Taibaiella chishuiensis]